jgi:predicted dehydrogenase
MIRAGLLGFGLGGKVFHAPLLSSVDGIELAAILERTTNKAQERYPHITTYRSLDAMLADSSLGLIVVSTPSGTHFDLAKQILSAGKNLVVDKPMCASSAEIAQLMELAKSKGVLLAPFHNRHWDGDYLTLQKLLQEGSLGRLVSFESTLDRWRPAARTDRLWKESPAEAGGVLLDLGTHLADQALMLFGKPASVGAELRCERTGQTVNDAFTLRLHYPELEVTLGATCLSALERPRFYLRGTKGNYWKYGVDQQEAELVKITRIASPTWGQEASSHWGTLAVDVDGGMVTRPVKPIPGDYRKYYEGIRDALLGKAPAPTSPIDSWRVARIMEWATISSEQHRDIPCDWSDEPEPNLNYKNAIAV